MCIPDAPWIRDAEINGMPDSEDVYCPVCGEENPDTLYIVDNSVIGCECCVRRVDAYEWLTAKK